MTMTLWRLFTLCLDQDLELGGECRAECVWSCETAPGHKSSPATVWMRWLCVCTYCTPAIILSSWFYLIQVSFKCLKLVLRLLWFLLALCYVWEKLERLWYRFISSYDGVLQYCHVSRVWSWHQDSWVVVLCDNQLTAYLCLSSDLLSDLSSGGWRADTARPMVCCSAAPPPRARCPCWQ